MKSTSRKRLLVSSVAMLLVAMLALGTATYAWFTTNTTSYADRINVATSKASTLVVSKSDKQWGTHVEYGVGTDTTAQTMFPASSADGSSWFKADAKDGTGVIDKTTLAAATKEGKLDPDYVFVNELNVKNDGKLKVTNIKIKFLALSNSSSYARIALVPKAGASSETDVVTTTGAFATNVYDNQGEKYYPVESTTTISSTLITANNATEISVPELAPGKMAYYDLYVWFEGQDKDCKNANSGQPIPKLRFDVTGTPVEA